MHSSTFEYLKPTDEQIEKMMRVRLAAREFCNVIEHELPEGPDKTYVVRNLRSLTMWASVAITRMTDGAPRGDLAYFDGDDNFGC